MAGNNIDPILRRELDSLRDLLILRMDSIKAVMDQKGLLVDKALEKAEANLAARLENLNEQRKQITDERAYMVRQEKFDTEIKSLRDLLRTEIIAVQSAIKENTKRVEALERFQANWAGRQWALNAVWAIAVVLLNIAITFVSMRLSRLGS